MEINLPYRFTPREYQEEPNRAIFIEGKKKILQLWHRRAGKTINMLNTIVGLLHKRVGLGLYTFPEFKQARRNIWHGMDSTGRRYLDYIPKELVSRFDKQEMLIEFKNGSLFQLGGTDNYDSLIGSNPIVVAYDEYALQDPMARLLLKPILLENNGIEIFVFTPRGRNHGYKVYKEALSNPNDWYCAKYGIDETKKIDGSPVIDRKVVDDLIKDGYPLELAKQEFDCSFDAGQVGSYYASQIEALENNGHIKDFEIESALPCRTIWDLGFSDDMGIAIVQNLGPEIRIIGYIRGSGEGFGYYAKELTEFSRKNKIQYIEHYAPHDIKVHEFSTGKTRLQKAAEYGIKFDVVPNLNITDGINLVREILPSCWIHKSNCGYLIDSLRDYHKEYDAKNGCFKEKPVHDWTSHAADVARYLAVIWNVRFEMSGNKNRNRISTYM
ncbi:MAG: hypothetical protein V3V84_00765 [Candidatus Bathyarchaeia archaeon]